MELIDTHCHLTTFEESALRGVFERAMSCDISRFICIGASDGIDSAKDAVSLSNTYDQVFSTIGVHPHDAGEFESLKELAPLLSEPKVVAIGETGLDFYRDWSPFDSQRKLFVDSIGVAREVNKPLIIHCRDAEEETLKILKEERASEVGGVFHCYAGSAEFAKELSDMNFKVSLTGILTFKNAHDFRAQVKQIPLEQIMLETDCPYMAPEPFRGKPSEPMHVYQIALKLAEVKELPLEEVAKITTKNAVNFFGLDASTT